VSRIAFITYGGAPEISADDRLVLPPLSRRGIAVEAVAWDAAGTAWYRYDAAVIRSSWDYHKRPEEFRRWLDTLDGNGTAIWNPPDVIRWNMGKRYLQELRDAGVPIVPTAWVDPGSEADPAGVLERRGWERAVVKPVISASAYRTRLISRTEAGEQREEIVKLADDTGVMIQEYFPEIETDGEWSLMLFGGEFSHAVRKRPKRGDFRVQTELGGSVRGDTPPNTIIAQGRMAAAAAPGFPHLYARIDGLVRQKIFHLMELELIEPSLFLEFDPAAAERFGETIGAVLTRTPPRESEK
jgi:glutathione synthase/RimK-type ligase-like ATP-grasp enzyme